MHEFRHDVFVRRLAWSLPMLDGAECDQYDHAGTRYFVASDEHGHVVACTRLLPTTARYMLPELFPQLLGDTVAPNDPSVWELSRFASNCYGSNGRVLSLAQSTLDLLHTVLSFARQNSIVRLALVTSIAIERLVLRAGFATHRIAAPKLIKNAPCVAIFIEVPESDSNTPIERLDDRSAQTSFNATARTMA
jgi:acyl homoserine lactone synthase